MDIVKNILIVIYFIICLVLIILVLKQNKDESGASGTIMGSSVNNFYEKNKSRTKEGRIKRATIILMILFFIFSIVLGILYI